MLCATTPQNTRQTGNRNSFKRVMQKNTHRPNCLCECQPEHVHAFWGEGGADGGVGGSSNDGGFTTTLYQTVPNTEQTNALRQTALNIKPSLRGKSSHVASPTDHDSRASSSMKYCSASSYLTLLFLALMSLVRYMHGIPHVWMHLCVSVCVCVCDLDHGCGFFSRSHSKILTFVFICPNLNQNNTVFGAGTGHLKSFVKCR